MNIVFKKCNKDFCLAINICVFYVYNLFLEYRDLGEGSGLGARGTGRGEEALFEMIEGKCQYYLVSVLDHPSFITYHNSGK